MTERFLVEKTQLEGLRVIRRLPIGDERGYLERLYCRSEFTALVGIHDVAQVNLTHTRDRGAVRGMHFQHPPVAETKLVSCLSGTIFDVAIDVRHGSPTFLQWFGIALSGEAQVSLLIPQGFAHGFQTLTPDCRLLYLHSAPYRAAAEGALNPLDPRLAIDWPEPVTLMSERDRGHPPVDNRFEGIRL